MDVRTLLIFLLLQIIPRISIAEVKCKVEESHNKVWMEPKSDHVGFCGGFATRVALHQYRCDMDEKNCVIPSVPGLLSVGWKTPAHFPDPMDIRANNPAHLLESVKASGVIEDESCAPFEEHFSEKMDLSTPTSFQVPFNFYYYNSIKKQMTCEEIKVLKSKTFELIGDSVRILKKAQEAFYGNIAEFVNQRNCNKRPFPSFQDKMDRATKNNIIRELKSGHTLITPLLVHPPDSSERGPHAVAVANYRTKCCGDICWTKYQVIDSLSYYWAKSANDTWVSEEDLIDQLQPEGMITWLEKPKVSNPKTAEMQK